jgi:hypothetical protein
MSRIGRNFFLLLFGITVAWTAVSFGAENRIGLEETFDTADGWVAGVNPAKPDERTKPKSVTSQDSKLIVETQLGVLDGINTPAFQARNIPRLPNVSWICKSFGTVDLDKFHYLVARMPTAQTWARLWINRQETRVLYTTGLHAEDLRELGFRGPTPITLQIMFYNGTGRVTLDDIRLVSELTPEERAGLIPPGFEVRPQGLKAGPYQGLEALYDRGRAPLAELLKSEAAAGGPGLAEWTVFQDEGTHAPITKLTRYPGSDYAFEFSSDGHWLLIKNALRPGYTDQVCDLRTHRVSPLPAGLHQFFPKDGNRTVLVNLERKGAGGRLNVMICDVRDMKLTTLVDQEVPELPMGETEFSFSEESNKFVIGIREHDVVFLVDPEADMAKRLRIIKLPYPLKALRLVNHDRSFYFANCFTYQVLYYDYETQQTHLCGYRLAGGHVAVGGGMRFGAYGNLLKLAHPDYDNTDTPGDAIRLLGNYRNSQVDVDYGIISPDGRWAFQDGVKGDVDRQIVAFDLNEGGNAMPIFFHNTSSVGWDVKPYVKVSPDSTKLALYSSDMLGDGDVMMVPFQRPEPPREVTVTKAANGAQIAWKPAAHSAEVQGYNVYHSLSRAGAFARLNETPIAATNFTHARSDAHSVYLVTAVDNSGLESRLPLPAMSADRPRDDAARMFFEAECATAITLPFRRQYDGAAANYSVMRLMPERSDETEGSLAFAIPADQFHTAGKRPYFVGLRCRQRPDIYPETKSATLNVFLDGRPAGSVTAGGARDFEWRFSPAPADLESGAHELRITSRAAGVEVDRVTVCGTEQNFTWAKDSRLAEPEIPPAAISSGQVTATADGPFAMKLSWIAPKVDVAYYSVHASPGLLTTLGNATLVGSTATPQFRDSGLRPATQLYYYVEAYDARGRQVARLTGQGRTEPLPAPQTLRLDSKSARLGAALETANEDGHVFVRVKAGQVASGAAATAHLDFNVSKPGDYAAWFYNRPFSLNRYLVFHLDKTAGGLWTERLISPGDRNEMISLIDRKKARWYANRLFLRLPGPPNPDGSRGANIAGQDVFHLEAGPHSIEFSFVVQDAKAPAADMGEFVVTNDLTWRPDDCNVRPQFNTASASAR